MKKYDGLKIGEKYNCFTVIGESYCGKNGYLFYPCRCECGTELSVSGTDLVNGGRISCGCVKRTKTGSTKKRGSVYSGLSPGSEFGSWLVLSEEAPMGGTAMYRCRCVCGKEALVEGKNLVNERTKSCGCSRKVDPVEKKKRAKKYKAEWFQKNKDDLQRRNNARQKDRRAKERSEFITDGYRLKSAYGLSTDQYKNILEDQDYKCAICGMPFSTKKGGSPCVDHNHTTREVRGLLCKSCNLALGLFKDDAGVLGNAVQYLERRGSYGGQKVSDSS